MPPLVSGMRLELTLAMDRVVFPPPASLSETNQIGGRASPSDPTNKALLQPFGGQSGARLYSRQLQKSAHHRITTVWRPHATASPLHRHRIPPRDPRCKGGPAEAHESKIAVSLRRIQESAVSITRPSRILAAETIPEKKPQRKSLPTPR